jgi:hypothetical protein
MTLTSLKILAAGLALAAGGGVAVADPGKDESGKDESGKGRERGGYAWGYDGDFGGYDRPRWERHAFKEVYDDGVRKVERKCRGGYGRAYR